MTTALYRELVLDLGFKNIRGIYDPHGLEALAKQIDDLGLIEPIVVRQKDDRFAVVCGFRRYLAIGLLVEKKVPSRREEPWSENSPIPIELRELTEEQAYKLNAAENAGKEDVRVIDKLERMTFMVKDLKLSTEDVARTFGITTTTLNNYVRSWESLCEEIKEQWRKVGMAAHEPKHADWTRWAKYPRNQQLLMFRTWREDPEETVLADTFDHPEKKTASRKTTTRGMRQVRRMRERLIAAGEMREMSEFDRGVLHAIRWVLRETEKL